jgi:hypothetical protein
VCSKSLELINEKSLEVLLSKMKSETEDRFRYLRARYPVAPKRRKRPDEGAWCIASYVFIIVSASPESIKQYRVVKKVIMQMKE